MELSTTSHFTTGCVDSAESRLVIGQNETALTKTSENSKSSSFPDNSLQFTLCVLAASAWRLPDWIRYTVAGVSLLFNTKRL